MIKLHAPEQEDASIAPAGEASDNAEPVSDQEVDDMAGCEDSSLLNQIAQAEIVCADAEKEVARRKVSLKDAKDEYEGAVSHLRHLARELSREQRPLLPFDQKPEQPTEEPQDGGWESEPIESLAMPPGLTGRLKAVGAETMGQLENLREEISLGRAEWPKGIGAAKVTMIEDRVIEWIAQHQDDEEDVDGEAEAEGEVEG